MIEVLKTNICNVPDAQKVLGLIHAAYPLYSANFDLQDCDHVLRVKTVGDYIDSNSLIRLVKRAGFYAAILPDEVPVSNKSVIITRSGKMKMVPHLSGMQNI